MSGRRGERAGFQRVKPKLSIGEKQFADQPLEGEILRLQRRCSFVGCGDVFRLEYRLKPH